VYQRDAFDPSHEDRYRVFMIIAISSITKYRRGETSEHPHGFFRAAQRYAPHVPWLGTLNSIQNLLLVARFAMYHHIECSIWDISRLCIRQCIELGLHRPPAQTLTPIEEQIRRNVFWDCYVHDRYSSGILGRPFAIAESQISVALPHLASEDEIIHAQVRGLDDLETAHTPNEVSVFRFVISLRRITGRIQTHFFSSDRYTAPSSRTTLSAGQARMDLDYYLGELRKCRDSAPVFEQPRSLYQRSEWYDFLAEKDRLLLIRGTIAAQPISGLHPSRNLLRMCLGCATRVIDLYISMFSRGHITWTRSYFQILFSSGLAIMYSLSILQVGVESDKQAKEAALAALVSCGNLLLRFVSEMPDAKRFALVFEALTKQYLTSRHASGHVTPHQSRFASPEPQGVVQLHPPFSFNQNEPFTIPREGGAVAETSLPLHTNFDFGIDDLYDWSHFSSNPDNFLGQVEAGLGEYAWGAAIDPASFDYYF
jgi:hypothetical protein